MLRGPTSSRLRCHLGYHPALSKMVDPVVANQQENGQLGKNLIQWCVAFPEKMPNKNSMASLQALGKTQKNTTKSLSASMFVHINILQRGVSWRYVVKVQKKILQLSSWSSTPLASLHLRASTGMAKGPRGKAGPSKVWCFWCHWHANKHLQMVQ